MPDQNTTPDPVSVLDQIELDQVDEVARVSTAVFLLMARRELLCRRIAGNLALLNQVDAAIRRQLDRHPEVGQ